MGENPGWKLSSIKKFVQVENEIPIPSDDEILIKVAYTGICGSDLHTYLGEHPLVKPGLILGHEFSGKISALGGNVDNFKIGERVTVEPSVHCGKCYNCKNGRYNICLNLKVLGNVGYDGSLQKYISVRKDKVYKIPNNLTLKEAILVEPLAVAVHAVRISQFKPGNKVLVIGAGPIGLFVTSFLSHAGASEIVVIDLLKKRLKFAESLSPKVIGMTPNDFDNEKFFGNIGPDIVFECVGISTTINFAIENARKGAQIVQVGVPQERSNVEMIFVQDRELNIQGSLMYLSSDFNIAIELLADKIIDGKRFISKKFEFDEVPEAFEYVLANKDKVIKAVINVGGDNI